MKKHWWKILGVVLVTYSLIVGMLVPLKPGIVEVSPGSCSTGDTISLKVKGYNSNFLSEKDNLRGWLKMDSIHVLTGKKIEVIDDRNLGISFEIPQHLPSNKKVVDFTLILDNPIDGSSLLPSAVFVTQDTIDNEAGLKSWPASQISNLHGKTKVSFPFLNILLETIRNTYYHVPLWFAMFIILISAVVMSIFYLKTLEPDYDRKAMALTSVGILFGILGVVTGAIWAKHTWGAYWSFDVKQNTTAIALLIYLAYFVLRGSFEDMEKKARIGAVYNIFAFATLIPLLYVIPKLADSLHPGSGGNMPIGSLDLDSTMRLIFYPAIIGWTLIGVWMAQLILRYERLFQKIMDEEG